MSTSANPTRSAAPGLEATRQDWLEPLIRYALLACATVSVLVTVGIVGVLLWQAVNFFGYVYYVNDAGDVVATAQELGERPAPADAVAETITPGEFLGGTRWAPSQYLFGILPLLCGTLLVTFGAALVAAPIGLGTAIYLSEYASPLVREIVKPVLEILAGIPSVVYGFFAVVAISPVVGAVFGEQTDTFNALNASIVVGFMVLPMVVSLSEDVLRSVPRSLREAAFALGATKYDVTAKVVVPAALSGVIASFLLAVSRAIGETMAVTLAAGQKATLTLNPLQEIQTMTAYIVAVRQGDNEVGSIQAYAIFAVGLALFGLTMVLNLLAQAILNRMRNSYE
ncbi:MAG: phosphate ABC transporter permease subunit PstC [Planctomycetota bacterium]